jgi:hypothetical protein
MKELPAGEGLHLFYQIGEVQPGPIGRRQRPESFSLFLRPSDEVRVIKGRLITTRHLHMLGFLMERSNNNPKARQKRVSLEVLMS